MTQHNATKRKAKRRLRDIEEAASPDGDAPDDDTFDVTINHVRVDFPPEDRDDPAGVFDDTAADGSDDPPDRSGNVVVDDFDDVDDAPATIRARYRFNPETRMYDIPVEPDDGGESP